MPSEMPGAGRAESEMDWDAIARYLAGESSAVEADAVRGWLANNPSDARMISALDDALGRVSAPPVTVDVDAALARVKARRSAPALEVVAGSARPRDTGRAVRPATRWVPYAAAAVLIIAVGAILATRRGTPAAGDAQVTTIAARTITTRIGGRDSLVLPDGSHVVLGPGTILTLGEGFGQTSRSITVHGEAYFDVHHDESHPFVVAANDARIRDVGTAFVVHSDSTGAVRVVVTAGVVELRQMRDSTSATMLKAGDIGRVFSTGAIVAGRGEGTADDLAWTRGRLVFRDTPMAEVRDDLFRWYGVHLDIRDSTLLRRPLSASFDGDPIGKVLDVISLAVGATIEMHGDTATVRLTPEAKRRE